MKGVSGLEEENKKLLLGDSATIMLILVVLWCIVSFVMMQIGSIMPNHAVKMVALVAGILVTTFSTAASIAVLIHLRKNQQALYTEELANRKTPSH